AQVELVANLVEGVLERLVLGLVRDLGVEVDTALGVLDRFQVGNLLLEVVEDVTEGSVLVLDRHLLLQHLPHGGGLGRLVGPQGGQRAEQDNQGERYGESAAHRRLLREPGWAASLLQIELSYRSLVSAESEMVPAISAANNPLDSRALRLRCCAG